MTFTREELATILDYAANAAASGPAGLAALGLANPTLALALVAAAPLLRAAAQLAHDGVDPIAHITRILDIDPLIAKVRTDIDALESEKFPEVLEVPPPAPSAPAT